MEIYFLYNFYYFCLNLLFQLSEPILPAVTRVLFFVEMIVTSELGFMENILKMTFAENNS